MCAGCAALKWSGIGKIMHASLSLLPPLFKNCFSLCSWLPKSRSHPNSMIIYDVPFIQKVQKIHIAKLNGLNVFFVFVSAGFSDHYGRYLLYRSQISRSLNPRSLFMYWRRSVKGVAVAKPSAAALSKVAKPNGHLICFVLSHIYYRTNLDYEKKFCFLKLQSM